MLTLPDSCRIRSVNSCRLMRARTVGFAILNPFEMKDRKNRSIVRGVEKLVGVPARGQRARLRLAIADDAGDDEIGVVEQGMDQGIAQLAPRGSTLGSAVRRDLEFHRAGITAETAAAFRFGCARYSESAPYKSLRDSYVRPGPGPVTRPDNIKVRSLIKRLRWT
jgi:hypothetical protein